MCRFLLAAALIVGVVGCGSPKKKDPDAINREGWRDAREVMKEYPYMVVGYTSDDKVWRTLLWDSEFSNSKWSTEPVISLWPAGQLGDAHYQAKTSAREPDVAVTAVIDLLSQENPQLLRCYYSASGELLSSDKVPQAAAAKKLKEYLRYFQINPQLVKKPNY